MWIIVHTVTDLIDSRQRMHQDHAVLCQRHRLLIDNILILQPLILPHVIKAFFLDTRQVQDIDIADDVAHILSNRVGSACLSYGVQYIFRHGKNLWTDKAKLDVIIVEQLRETVDRSAVLQISDHRDLQTVSVVQFLNDGEVIEQSLCRMLANTVAGVDDRLGCIACRHGGCSYLRMSQYDNVNIAFQGPHSVR